MAHIPNTDSTGHFLTGLDSLNAMTPLIFPGSVAAACYNFLAVVLFYIFKSNRKFPVVILGWIGAVNTLYASYLIAKWAPGSESRRLLLIQPQAWSCFLEIFADHAYQTSICCLNTVIAAVMFLSVVKRIDVDYNSKLYYYLALAFIWGYTLIVAFANAGPAGKLVQGYCVTDSQNKEYIIISYLVLLTIQVVLIVLTIAKVFNITKFAKNIAAPNQRAKKRTRILMIRFSITIFSQMMNVSSYLLLAMSPNATAVVLFYACITIPLAMFIDGTVLLFLNRPLLKQASSSLRELGLGSLGSFAWSAGLSQTPKGASVQLEETPMNS